MASESKALRVLNLFEQYYDRVYCFARRSVDGATAEDIAQEVFVRLLDVQDLESREIQVSYLIKIADNLIKRGYRRTKLMERHALDRRREMETDHRAEAKRPRGEGARAELQMWGFGALTEREQEAVRLIVLRGLSYEEAARALGVKATSVNNWKFRGVQRMKQHTSRQETAGRKADGPSNSTEVRSDRDQSGRARYGQRAG